MSAFCFDNMCCRINNANTAITLSQGAMIQSLDSKTAAMLGPQNFCVIKLQH